ncbi:MAG: nucleotidyltransferase domain-containing protein [Alphaproteobacteria bacterium]|nr:nucleotidyltransferase domain-containing protein [Alphaproteobacteria bacterium]
MRGPILEFDGNQRRHVLNVQQQFAAWREDRRALRRIGGMHWKTGGNGQRYLYATNGRKEKSLGVKSEETEAIYKAHGDRVEELRARIEKSADLLDRSARVSKALYLGRVPTIAAKILRKLDDEGWLDGQLMVAGTNALFAYEFGTGVLVGEDLIATEDLDLLWDPRHRLSFVSADESSVSVLGLIKQVDRSFRKRRPYQAINDDSYLVDVIRPVQPNEMFKEPPKLTKGADEFDPSPIEGLAWLVSAPRYEQIAIAEDGWPVRIVTIDPRAYALHKVWLSKRSQRESLKRRRDLAQAKAVAELAVHWLNLRFDGSDLSALPVELLDGMAELKGLT